MPKQQLPVLYDHWRDTQSCIYGYLLKYRSQAKKFNSIQALFIIKATPPQPQPHLIFININVFVFESVA